MEFYFSRFKKKYWYRQISLGLLLEPRLKFLKIIFARSYLKAKNQLLIMTSVYFLAVTLLRMAERTKPYRTNPIKMI